MTDIKEQVLLALRMEARKEFWMNMLVGTFFVANLINIVFFPFTFVSVINGVACFYGLLKFRESMRRQIELEQKIRIVSSAKK